MKIDRVAAVLALGGLSLLGGCAWHHMTGAAGETSSAAPATRPELSQGTVKQVQTELKQAGVYQGTVDGLWGPDTVRAVLSYQQNNKLRPTGELDAQTLAALHVTPGANAAAAPPPMQQPPPGQSQPPAVGNIPAPPGNFPNTPPAAGQTQTQ